jgi:Flp pilus assembly protein TadG
MTTMTGSRASNFVGCNRATTAVEFGLVLPALAALTVGGLYAGLTVYSAAGLRSAVEQAARCYSVNSAQCSGAAATETYAQSQYFGINNPAFTAVMAGCGHQVSGTVTVGFTVISSNLSVPLSASACFP